MKEKRIEKEELFGILYNTINGADFDDLNEAVYKISDVAGYRKQSEGEWEEFHGERFICNNCAKVFGLGSTATLYDVKRVWKYCPNCGAKMKGGVQE